MDNIEYNSLTEKLISNGLIPSSKEILKDEEEDFSQSPIENPKIPEFSKNKKRINNYDFEFVKNASKNKNSLEFKLIFSFMVIRKILNIKKPSYKLENLLFKFFPNLYKVKLTKDALIKLSELDIDAKTLLDKTIPYGESEIRYRDLVEYLKHANEIQTCLNKKTR